jgi:hypothetical protein
LSEPSDVLWIPALGDLVVVDIEHWAAIALPWRQDHPVARAIAAPVW